MLCGVFFAEKEFFMGSDRAHYIQVKLQPYVNNIILSCESIYQVNINSANNSLFDIYSDHETYPASIVMDNTGKVVGTLEEVLAYLEGPTTPPVNTQVSAQPKGLLFTMQGESFLFSSASFWPLSSIKQIFTTSIAGNFGIYDLNNEQYGVILWNPLTQKMFNNITEINDYLTNNTLS
jgi:hypothetical protein